MQRVAGVWVGCMVMLLLRAAEASPALRDEVLANFNLAMNAQLTPDGRWLAYSVIRADRRTQPEVWGETAVVVRSTQGEIERTYGAGEGVPGVGTPKLADSGRWMAFVRALPPAEGADKGKERSTAVVLVQLETGKVSEWRGWREVAFAGTGEREWMVLQGPASAAGFQLQVRVLGEAGVSDEGVLVMEGVKTAVLNQSMTRMAWTDRRGLHAYEFASGRPRLIDEGGVEYAGVSWSERGNALAALRKTRDGYILVTATGLNRAAPSKGRFDPRQWRGFPAGYELSASPITREGAREASPTVLSWREDEQGVFFNIRETVPPAGPPEAGVPDLVLWHWQGELPGSPRPGQQVETQYLSFVSLAEGRFVRLSDETLARVEPHPRGRWVLGFDKRAYQSPWFHGAGSTYGQRDYSVVELATGKRTLMRRGLWVTNVGMTLPNPPRLSPDGTVVLYQDDAGDYQVHTVASGESRNVTAGLPTRFYYEENLESRRALRELEGWLQVAPFQGWTADGAYALMSDYRDVWALPLRGGEAWNVTGNGGQEDIVYERILMEKGPEQHALRYPLDFLEGSVVDLRQPVYFKARNRRSGQSGLARRRPGDAQIEVLGWEAAQVDYYRAARAPVYLSRRSTAGEDANYYRLDERWRAVQRLTDLNPKMRALGLREPLYFPFQMGNGETWYAVLQLPFDVGAGEPYPTVVTIYEQLEGVPHDNLLGEWLGVFQENGYALLFVHIQPQLNEAGRIAVEAVSAAVEAAVATGAVDRERLGLTGYSYGGYETNFIITQTDLFKAAASRGGISNLLSFCTGVYPHGDSFAVGCATDQPYLGGWWWDQLPAYLENSPLHHARNIRTPLLLIHGDEDSGAPFTQAVELFNTLRHMGKPAALLQYVGQGHIGRTPDSDARMLQFFNHYLKGAPAPKWWSEGESYQAGQAPKPAVFSDLVIR